jgi:hypothetical protein
MATLHCLLRHALYTGVPLVAGENRQATARSVSTPTFGVGGPRRLQWQRLWYSTGNLLTLHCQEQESEQISDRVRAVVGADRSEPLRAEMGPMLAQIT